MLRCNYSPVIFLHQHCFNVGKEEAGKTRLFALIAYFEGPKHFQHVYIKLV